MVRVSSVIFSLAACLIISACGSSEDISLSPAVKKYLELKSYIGTTGNNDKSADSFTGILSEESFLQFVNNAMSSRNSSDCPLIYVENGAVVHDYGDGCNIASTYTNIHWGKYYTTSTGGYQGNEDSYKDHRIHTVHYEKLGGYYSYKNRSYTWGIDGIYQIEINEELNWSKPGLYQSYHRLSDFDKIVDDITEHHYLETQIEIDPEYYITPLQVYGFSYGENGANFFNSEVIDPLICQFECSNEPRMFDEFHIGQELVTWALDGNSGEFISYYGSGKCDKMAFIIENGVETQIKLSDYYKD